MKPRFVVGVYGKVRLKLRLEINRVEASLDSGPRGKLMLPFPRPRPYPIAARWWFHGGMRFSLFHQRASKKYHAQRELIYKNVRFSKLRKRAGVR